MPCRKITAGPKEFTGKKARVGGSPGVANFSDAEDLFGINWYKKNPDIPPRNCSSCGGKMNASTKAETCNLCQKKIQEEFLKNFSWK